MSSKKIFIIPNCLTNGVLFIAGGALKVDTVTADLFKQDALYSGEDLLRVEIREGFQN